MKVIFAGTPSFAETALEALIHSSHEVVAVFTQPDRKAGRGLKLTPPPVKNLALTFNLPVFQPASLKEVHEQDLLRGFNADVMVVAAYGLLLPAAVLNIPRLGCINIHPSLLPRWRGAAPIPRTIFAGDTITGVTIMQMDQGLDTGPILLQQQYVLDPEETAVTLHDTLAQIGGELLIKTLDQLEKTTINARAQDNTLATYAHKISKEEGLIDWNLDATEIENVVRAFNPWPVAYTTWQGENLRVWQARALNHDSNAEPRTLIAASQQGIDIAAGRGTLRLLSVQLPGGKRLRACDFYNAKHDLLIPKQHFI